MANSVGSSRSIRLLIGTHPNEVDLTKGLGVVDGSLAFTFRRPPSRFDLIYRRWDQHCDDTIQSY